MCAYSKKIDNRVLFIDRVPIVHVGILVLCDFHDFLQCGLKSLAIMPSRPMSGHYKYQVCKYQVCIGYDSTTTAKE